MLSPETIARLLAESEHADNSISITLLVRNVEAAYREELLAGAELPALPQPAKKQMFFCNKCGTFGEGSGEIHDRSNGSRCGYLAANEGPYFTADQMRAYGQQCAAVAHEKRREMDAKWLDEESAAMFDQRNHAIETRTIGGRRVGDQAFLDSFSRERRALGEAYQIAADAIRKGGK